MTPDIPSILSSMADIIDNSIAASASQIDITINMDPNLGLTIYVADNGIVMSEKGFLNAMKYGSDRRENLANLVKLDLWLKTSSTTFCHLLYIVYQSTMGS